MEEEDRVAFPREDFVELDELFPPACCCACCCAGCCFFANVIVIRNSRFHNRCACLPIPTYTLLYPPFTRWVSLKQSLHRISFNTCCRSFCLRNAPIPKQRAWRAGSARATGKSFRSLPWRTWTRRLLVSSSPISLTSCEKNRKMCGK